jgi:hypothetical protein
MKKETYNALNEAVSSLATNTNIIHSDISSLIRLFDENRKQLIISSLTTIKDRIDFLETEINLIDAKNHFIEA